MCTHQKLIENRYTKRWYMVKCGHCPSCLQEKAAHRVSRIQHTNEDSLDTMMISLTYRRGCAPYIDRNEAYEFAHGKRTELNVYRDTKYRRVRLDSDYNIGFKAYKGQYVLTTVPYLGFTRFDKLKDLAHEHNKIGVCYYPDFQRFVARLRLNLKRLYNYEYPFKTYMCSEFGSKSHRPHGHIILHYRKGDFDTLRAAVIKSWPFSDMEMFPRSIEKCYRGSSYVASYVNCGSDFPSFLKRYFKPKHSYSKGYGLGSPVYSLSSILSHFERGSLSFGMLLDKQGVPKVCDVPMPAYVIHRYFPKFKGYSRISPTSLESVMSGIRNFEYEQVDQLIKRNCIYYSMEEFNKFSVMLNNAFERFKSDCPGSYKFYSFENYIRLHHQIWSLHSSTCLKLHLLNDSVPLNEKYDNLEYVNQLKSVGRCPPGFEKVDTSVVNPNEFKSVIAVSNRFTQGYYENVKHRSVSNAVLSTISEEW